MDNLFNTNYTEIGRGHLFQPGQEYVMHVEIYDAGTHMAGWHERKVTQSGAAGGINLRYTEHCRWYEYDVYIPLLGGDAARSPASLAEVKQLCDEVIPKVEDASPLEDWTAALNPTGVAPGGVNDNLMYQMGRLSIDSFETVGTIGGLISKEMHWGGLMWGNGIRMNGEEIFLQESGSQFHSLDKIVPFPCIIAHCFGIPANFDVDEWSAEELYFPVGYRIERMRFLAPRQHKLTGATTILPATENDARRWMSSWRSVGDRQLQQIPLMVNRHYQHMINRNGTVGPKVIADDQA